MPRIHDPDLVIARTRLEGASTLLRGAMAQLFKQGAVDSKVWNAILEDLDVARNSIKPRVGKVR